MVPVIASSVIISVETQFAFGAVLSSIVTVAVQVEKFPLVSVKVSVTVLAPILANEKISGVLEGLSHPPDTLL